VYLVVKEWRIKMFRILLILLLSFYSLFALNDFKIVIPSSTGAYDAFGSVSFDRTNGYLYINYAKDDGDGNYTTKLFVSSDYGQTGHFLTISDINGSNNLKGKMVANGVLYYVTYIRDKGIFFTKSFNRGVTWSKAIQIIDDTNKPTIESFKISGSNLYVTSRYDDINSDNNFHVEFQKEPNSASHLGLAIDVTVSEELNKKFKIKEIIK